MGASSKLTFVKSKTVNLELGGGKGPGRKAFIVVLRKRGMCRSFADKVLKPHFISYSLCDFGQFILPEPQTAYVLTWA